MNDATAVEVDILTNFQQAAGGSEGSTFDQPPPPCISSGDKNRGNTKHQTKAWQLENDMNQAQNLILIR